MYRYNPPKPIIIKLIDEWGFEMREAAAKFVDENRNTTGAERGNIMQQGFGALAEIVIRNKLGMPNINPAEHPVGYDVLLPSGVKVDVKCRGGQKAFQEEYEGSDGLKREAKHNLFARQVFNEDLDTDLYVMTHLESPKDAALPGTKRQRKWTLYICGWVSKKRVLREGVYLPRGSITERGRSWFAYRGQEIEFYNKNLNGFDDLTDLHKLEPTDVESDSIYLGELNMTTVDAIRIAYDLIGRGVLQKKHVDFIKTKNNLEQVVKPILNANQYFHLLGWLKKNEQISDIEVQKAQEIMSREEYDGI